jgi:DNA-binding NarL/FixJ family response regulator
VHRPHQAETQARLNPLHVLLVTDDPGLAKGMSAALSEPTAFGGFASTSSRAGWPESRGCPDVIILDPRSRGCGSVAECYPDALVLRVRDDEPEEADVESHLFVEANGYIRRQSLDELAPIIIALAALSSVGF